MAGAQAINGFDPYFLQAYNSPNALQMQQLQQAQQATQTQQAANNPNSVFQNTVPRAQEPKKKSNVVAWCVLGVAALAGAGWLIRRGQKAGAEGILNQIKAGFQSFGSKATAQETVTAGMKNGKKVCTLPGKRNVMRKAGEVVDELAQIGVKDGAKLDISDITRTLEDGTQALAEGFSVRRGTFKIGDNFVTIKNGEVFSYVDKNGKDIMSRYLEPEAVSKFAKRNKANKKLIDELVSDIKNGRKLERVRDLEIVHNADGVVRKFVRHNPTDGFNLEYAIADRFNIGSDVVKSYRLKHPSDHEFLSKIEKGEAVGNILKAEYSSKIGTLLIENNEIVGIRDAAGKIYAKDSTKFNALQYDNHKIFEKALTDSKNYTNVTRIPA